MQYKSQMIRPFAAGVSAAKTEHREPSLPLRLRSGDLVAVRSAEEILSTLDENGTLDSLPFMPEMLEFCGRQFRVWNRVVQSTIDGAFLSVHTESFVREFRNDDVVTLKQLRCSGASHDGCQRGCAIFWKEAWLRRTDESQSQELVHIESAQVEYFSSKLRTKTEPGRYFCQSSEFLKATLHLSTMQRLKKCFSAIAARNISAFGMAKRLSIWLWWKMYKKFIGVHAYGSLDKTPTESLHLQPGELVQIKTLQEICETLNRKGRNRGLHFSEDQRSFCGKRYQVRNRADNFIAEGTGEMKHFQNTVMLQDVLCDSATFAFGGCYRADLIYWREIWLRRVEALSSRTDSESNIG